MNTQIITLAAGLFIAASAFTSLVEPTENNKPVQTKNTKLAEPGFAVVELFTSEGCSSCPPSDELVAKVQQENSGKPVYILAFHVDYWDFQGWKDVFSKSEFTSRQYQYSTWLRTKSVYTPQIVVNGKREFVGSEESSLRNAISQSLSSTVAGRFTIETIRKNKGISIRYQTSSLKKDAVLQLALVQKTAKTAVKRGENESRELVHVQIVRALQSQSLNDSGSGEAELKLPEKTQPDNWEIIAFLQNKTNGEILAAAKTSLKETI
jgi:hypothetical protein